MAVAVPVIQLAEAALAAIAHVHVTAALRTGDAPNLFVWLPENGNHTFKQ
jgi:hypothetical protein